MNIFEKSLPKREWNPQPFDLQYDALDHYTIRAIIHINIIVTQYKLFCNTKYYPYYVVFHLSVKRMQTYAQKSYQWKTFKIFWLFSAIFGSLKSFYQATMILDHHKIAKQPISAKKWSKNMAQKLRYEKNHALNFFS